MTSRKIISNKYLTIISGTLLAQIIGICFIPIITRLYNPESLGIQSIFNTILSISIVISTLNYPSSIILAESKNEAESITKLAIITGASFSIIEFLLITIYDEKISLILNSRQIKDLLYLIPFFTIISLLGNILEQWLTRENNFKLISLTSISTSALQNASKATFGINFSSATTLIASNFAATTISILTTFILRKKCLRKKEKSSNDHIKLLSVAKKYRDFPLFRTPQVILNLASHNLPIILLASFFNASASGKYSIALTALGTPVAIIGASLNTVFYPHIAEIKKNNGDVKSEIKKTIFKVLKVGIIPFIIFLLFSPTIFTFSFGNSWSDAGKYAQILSPWIFLQLLNKPIIASIPALGLQKLLLNHEIISFLTKLGSLYMGFRFYEDEMAAILLFSITGTLSYAVLIYLVIWKIDSNFKKSL